MNVYERNPDAAPDSDFRPGTLPDLVVGNRGRLLDARRTPVTVVRLRPDVGHFVVRLDDFEDRGAEWEIPFERVSSYQFARDAPCAKPAAVAGFRDAITRFDRPMRVPCDPATRAATDARLDALAADAGGWLQEHATFIAAGADLPDPERREGHSRLQADLRGYLAGRGLAELDEAFSRQFVSNPYSGEMVKGHRIVIAELGLVPYEGSVVRDPDLFAGSWSRLRRAEHVVARLGFLRALFALLGRGHVGLYRGTSTDEALRAPRNDTFVSATFSRAVAESHFESVPGEDASRALLRQPVPVQRLFMTYLETAAMNDQFREAEAVLLFEPRAWAF